MATLTKGKTFTNGELVTPQKIHELVDLGTVSNIVNADIAAGAAIADTKLATISTSGKVANTATTATNANTANAIVARDASGNFSAGTITATLSGNASSATTAAACTGNAATATTAASCSGNAATATTLQTARTINGVSFNGSANITVTAAPNAHTHAASDITTGTLDNARTTATSANTANAIVARDASGNFSAGTITAALSGNASSATTATNLAGGAANSVPYQSAVGTTAMLAVGSAGQVLTSNGSASAPSWQTLSATATNANNITGGNAGEILYQSAAATTAKLAAGTSGQVLRSNGTAAPSWLTLATSATTDTTNAGNISSGTLAIARIPTGTTATTVCIGNDSRLSDARPPTTHTHAINDTTGLQTALDGKQAALGFTPVQQGGGANQTANKLFMGWSGTSQLRLQIDSTDFGPTWPINISGTATPNAHTHAISDTTGLQTALDGKQAAGNYASASHLHYASDIAFGTLSIGRIPTGSTNATVCIGNDTRLSDSRTPTAHTHDAATDITSGTLANARTTATSANTANAIVARDASGDFITGNIFCRKTGGGRTQADVSLWTNITSGTGGYATVDIGHENANIGERFLGFFLNSVPIGTITRNGASSVAYNTTSDYRLKTNIEPLTNAVTRLLQIPVHRFNWTADPEGNKVDGFLAHEAQAVVPEAVTGTKDAVDAEGKPIYQGIDQSKLVPLLVAAVQELAARVEALEAAR